jgi:hypothetical protein
MSQEDILLQAMREGRTITPAVAQELCGTLACHSAISRLRARGFVIPCKRVTQNGKHFGSYTLIKTDLFA